MEVDICVQPNLMSLFRETSNLTETVNKVLQKFAVPLVGYASKYASVPYNDGKKGELITGFTYFATMVALEKFTAFLD